MNIFYLDDDLQKCAQYNCDAHVRKIILESAQLASTALVYCGGENAPYTPTHINHPWNKWARANEQNYVYICKHGLALCNEFTFRYGKIHKTQSCLEYLLNQTHKLKFENKDLLIPMCMPDDCKIDNHPIEAYRSYYNMHKRHLFSWKNRSVPEWIIGI